MAEKDKTILEPDDLLTPNPDSRSNGSTPSSFENSPTTTAGQVRGAKAFLNHLDTLPPDVALPDDVGSLDETLELTGFNPDEFAALFAGNVQTTMANTDAASLYDVQSVDSRELHQLLISVGGVVSESEFLSDSGLSRDEISRLSLMSFEAIDGEEGTQYPAFQAYQGELLAGVERIIEALRGEGLNDLAILRFFAEPQHQLNGVSPIDRLRTAHTLALHAETDPAQSDGITAVLATVNQYLERGSK